MNNFINDAIEHSGTKALGVIAIFTGFGLDALNKTDYYKWAAFIIVCILVFIFIRVYFKRKMYYRDTLPIPIVINVGSNTTSMYALKSLFENLEKDTQFKNLKSNLKHYRNIVEDDLVFTYNGDPYDQERILSFIQIVHYQIRKIKENIPNKVEFHLAFFGRPAFGIFLGYVFAEEDLVLYQKAANKDHFDKVAEIDNRSYKKEVHTFEKFTVETLKEDDTCDRLLIGIKAAGHKINFNAEGLNGYKNVISIVAKHDGSILIEEDWVRYAREIFTVLNEQQTKYKHITIAHAMPETIGLMLGMSVGNYWSLMITQYDRGDYLEIINTNEIKCYF